MSSKPKKKRSFKEKIRDLIWVEGTYGEILPPDSVILAENRDKINRIREAMRKHIAKKRAAKKQAEKEQA